MTSRQTFKEPFEKMSELDLIFPGTTPTRKPTTSSVETEAVPHHIISITQSPFHFEVDYADVVKYKDSFIAAYVRNALQRGEVLEEIKSIKVEERDPQVFPFVQKFYKEGKLKLNNTDDKRTIMMEFLFWFTTSTLNIKYKDPIAELNFLRSESVRDDIFKIEDIIVPKVTVAAQCGRISCNVGSFRFFPRDKNLNEEYSVVINDTLSTIFPQDVCHATLTNTALIIHWSLEGNGPLALATRKIVHENCKKIWRSLYLKSLSYSNTGLSRSKLGDFNVDKRDILGAWEYYGKYFREYITKKTTYPVNLTWQPIQRYNSEELYDINVNLEWGLQPPSLKRRRIDHDEIL